MPPQRFQLTDVVVIQNIFILHMYWITSLWQSEMFVVPPSMTKNSLNIRFISVYCVGVNIHGYEGYLCVISKVPQGKATRQKVLTNVTRCILYQTILGLTIERLWIFEHKYESMETYKLMSSTLFHYTKHNIHMGCINFKSWRPS